MQQCALTGTRGTGNSNCLASWNDKTDVRKNGQITFRTDNRFADVLRQEHCFIGRLIVHNKLSNNIGHFDIYIAVQGMYYTS